jgi:hypothetical protein
VSSGEKLFIGENLNDYISTTRKGFERMHIDFEYNDRNKKEGLLKIVRNHC